MVFMDNGFNLLSKGIESVFSLVSGGIFEITLPNWTKFSIETGVRLINKEVLFKREVLSGGGNFAN